MTGTQCAIVGSAETEVGRSLDRSALDIRMEAATSAIRDAGLDKRQIDGVITRQPHRDPEQNQSAGLAQRLGIQPRYINDISLSGAAAGAMVVNAVMAIRAGLCTTVLCVGGDGSTTVSGKGGRGKMVSA